MKEQFVSFETAILAKEKGFNVETLHFYCKNRTCDYIKTPYKYSFEVNANQERLINGEIDNFGYGITWSAPRQSLLQKWLRDDYNIFVEVNVQDGYYTYFNYLVYNRLDSKVATNRIKSKVNTHKTYEQALEIGLQEALKLIK